MYIFYYKMILDKEMYSEKSQGPANYRIGNFQ